MQNRLNLSQDRVDRLTNRIARQAMVSSRQVVMFRDFVDALAAICTSFADMRSTITTAGVISPDVAIAFDRANLSPDERLGTSPFTGDVQAAIDNLKGDELVYMANPNRVTGANFSRADMQEIADAVPNGLLIVDEQYHDYYGISAVPLLERHDNVIIMRSFTAGFSIGSEAGFVVGTNATLAKLPDEQPWRRMSSTLERLIETTLDNDNLKDERLKLMHDEALRIASQLNQLGVQSRITATDFLLLRVKDTKEVCNSLAKYRIPIENLDGYPGMANYLRYRIQGAQNNDEFLLAFKRMSPDNYRMASGDRRSITLRGTKEDTTANSETAPETGADAEEISRVEKLKETLTHE